MNNPKKIRSKRNNHKENMRRLRKLPIMESTLKFLSNQTLRRLHKKGIIK